MIINQIWISSALFQQILLILTGPEWMILCRGSVFPLGDLSLWREHQAPSSFYQQFKSYHLHISVLSHTMITGYIHFFSMDFCFCYIHICSMQYIHDVNYAFFVWIDRFGIQGSVLCLPAYGTDRQVDGEWSRVGFVGNMAQLAVVEGRAIIWPVNKKSIMWNM